MKTLSNLIREIFAARRTDKERPPIAEKETTENNQPEVKPIKNPKTNEAKDYQDSGNPQLDNPHAGEDPRDDQKPQQPGEEQGQQLQPQQEGEQRDGERELRERELRSAFEQGVIAGRNAKIEETYFPKTDDEIPRLNGRPANYGALDDIFSLAREA